MYTKFYQKLPCFVAEKMIKFWCIFGSQCTRYITDDYRLTIAVSVYDGQAAVAANRQQMQNARSYQYPTNSIHITVMLQNKE